ncbi:hypothetical protein XA68_13526 [Ophiocordyceps unilateralis]|uniref:DUF1772 domain-containing protein n=1 Tax=Ophiocordyceps unilateralis TaxID=268505 RepID=A0A2A9PM64_OPHUN|nr:hypothetical protein XA68_13526 [Ophiocordyceps unilateralis]
MQFPAPPLIAVATGIVGSAWASGAIVTFSISAAAATKAVSDATTAAQVWCELYARGSNVMPKVAVTVALSYAYAAYDVFGRGGRWVGFAAAACSILSIVPFTLTAMKKTNAELHQATVDTPDAARVSSLIDTWVSLNFARGLLPLIGTVLGIQSFLENTL